MPKGRARSLECRNSNQIKMLTVTSHHMMLDMPDAFFDEYLLLEEEIEITEVIDRDDKVGFVDLVKALPIVQFSRGIKLERDVPETIEATYCPSEVFRWLCNYGAVDCTKALLEGDTPFFVDLNVPFRVGLYPLHIAAGGFLYGMIDLLLCHGARTDVRTIEGQFRGDLLPLNVALETLSYHQYLFDWTPKQSIFKLIAILSLPQMKVPLETNRLLAWNTKDVDNIFIYYAMEGNLIQMAALLMVAREKIMAPSTLQSKDGSGLGGGMMIRQCILEEIASLTDEEVEVMNSSKNCNRRLKNKKAVMTIALLLLEVFDRAGDAIETYRQSVRCHTPKEKVGKDIKALLEEFAFDLKDKNVDLSDIDCESEDIKLATEVLEKRTSFRSQLQMPLHSLSDGFDQAKNPITNKINELKWSIQTFLPWELPALLLEHRYPIKEMRSAMKISAAYFLIGEDFLHFALAIKRGLTRL